MPLTLISSPRFAEHQMPPGHPERRERAEAMEVVASRWRERGVKVLAPRAATRDELVRVHTPEYVGLIAETAGRAVALDADTYTSAGSYDIARLAAGAAVQAVDTVMDAAPAREETLQAVLAMVRPPGHHAEPGRAMGFCLFNNVAVAAAHARTLGASRVAIVDYDVHHGNGTQHVFEDDPSVLYVSLHQFPFYPGTGAAGEIGRGEGRGFTVNLPIEVGAIDEDYRVAFSEVVVPVLEQYGPDLLLVSAGFDAHERDPLGGMRLSTGAFAAMTTELREVAERRCQGRLVLVTEGGYDLRALAASLDAVAQSLAGRSVPPADPQAPGWAGGAAASDRGRAAVAEARRALGPFWRLD